MGRRIKMLCDCMKHVNYKKLKWMIKTCFISTAVSATFKQIKNSCACGMCVYRTPTCCPCRRTPILLILVHWRQSPSSTDRRCSGDSKEDRWLYVSPWETDTLVHSSCGGISRKDDRARRVQKKRVQRRSNSTQHRKISSVCSPPVDIGFG